MILFAHGEELHTEETTETVHFLTQTPVALAVYALVLFGLWLIARKTGKTVPVIIASMVLNFVAGVAFFSIIPWVSVIALTLGIATALLFTLSSISIGR